MSPADPWSAMMDCHDEIVMDLWYHLRAQWLGSLFYYYTVLILFICKWNNSDLDTINKHTINKHSRAMHLMHSIHIVHAGHTVEYRVASQLISCMCHIHVEHLYHITSAIMHHTVMHNHRFSFITHSITLNIIKQVLIQRWEGKKRSC